MFLNKMTVRLAFLWPYTREIKTLSKDGEIMLGYTNESPHWIFLNHILIIGKQVIYSSRLSKSKSLFSTCTNPIIHLFNPPKFCIIIVCNFCWDMKMSSGKSKKMPMQTFWGVEAVYYGIVQVENYLNSSSN